MIDNTKIFLYLRLRNEKEILARSKIREFSAIQYLLIDFLKNLWKRFGFEFLRAGTFEFVDANTELILISYKYNIITHRLIISGIIPKEYQYRMLNEREINLKYSLEKVIDDIYQESLDSLQRDILYHKINTPNLDILKLIKDNIKNTGEFFIKIDMY